MKKAKYTEPKEYIPKDIRKEFKLGEYAEKEDKKANKKEERTITNEDFRKYLKGE